MAAQVMEQPLRVDRFAGVEARAERQQGQLTPVPPPW